MENKAVIRRQTAIPLEDWQNSLQRDPELRLEALTGRNPATGERLVLPNPGLGCWFLETGLRFFWSDGALHTEWVDGLDLEFDEVTRHKVEQLAARLGASVEWSEAQE